MIKVKFSDQDLKTIEHERFNHPVPRVQRRMEVLWLKSQGLPHKKIAKLAGVCDNALTKYLRLYQQGGLDEIRKVNFYRPQSELEKYSESIEQHFRDNPVASINEAVAQIEKLTGIRRSKTQVRTFLRKLGMRHRKVGSVPAKADLEKQEHFKKNTLNQD
jgi:transposase